MRAIIRISLIFAGVFLLQSCQSEVQQQPAPKTQKLTESNLKTLVLEGLKGSKTANDSLSGLFDTLSADAQKYQNLEVGQVEITNGNKDFYVLLQYSNPLYNRLAIYGDNLKCYLIDRSLTGNINSRAFQNEGRKYLEVNEGFRAKDIYKLDRVSIYQLSDSSASLVFRTFTKVEDPYLRYSQKISGFSPDTIKTTIDSRKEDYQIRHDYFVYDPKMNKYKSSVNMFDSLVKFILNQSSHRTTGKILKNN